MRWAKNYGIVDREILHGEYLHRMSHEAMSLYLFLVVVSDRTGKSYYGEQSIQNILRLSPQEFEASVKSLISLNLIDYRRPNFWLKNLGVSHERQPVPDPIPERQQRSEFSSDRKPDWHTAKESIQNLLRSLAHD